MLKEEQFSILDLVLGKVITLPQMAQRIIKMKEFNAVKVLFTHHSGYEDWDEVCQKVPEKFTSDDNLSKSVIWYSFQFFQVFS